MNSNLTCAEFQQHLPEIFSSGDAGALRDPALEEHLRTCENCSALVRDLRYIAEEAERLLKPAFEEPSDAVWASIQSRLKESPLSDEPE